MWLLSGALQHALSAPGHRALLRPQLLARWLSAKPSAEAAAQDSQPSPHADTPTSHAGTDRSTPASSSSSSSSGGGGNSPRPASWYNTTPLMMDANSKEPLKSSEYASSHNDAFGVQKNWFTSLYKQLNYFAKTGAVPGLKGRQKEVFEAVEREFEGLYERHCASLTGMEHRAMLMVCLSIATHRVLTNEVPDPKLVQDVIRTNQGSLMMGLLLPLHRVRLWVLRYLLAEDPFKLAVQFLPALQSDMGALCTSEIRVGSAQQQQQAHASGGAEASASGQQPQAHQTAAAGPSSPATPITLPPSADEASLVITRCQYHAVLTKEDAPFLLSDFCCNHGMVWLNEFSKHGVDVSLDRCMVWEDECCSIRLARRKQQRQ